VFGPQIARGASLAPAAGLDGPLPVGDAIALVGLGLTVWEIHGAASAFEADIRTSLQKEVESSLRKVANDVLDKGLELYGGHTRAQDEITEKATIMILVLFSAVPPSGAGLGGGLVARELGERVLRKTASSGLDDVARAGLGDVRDRVVARYGDDVLRGFDDGGEALLRAVQTHGDEVAELATVASPDARRAFLKNVPDLLPAAQRIGPEVLELEARSGGRALMAIDLLGDDGARLLARRVPAREIPRMLRYAQKAPDQPTRKLLLEAYEAEGKSLFERIPPRLVLASGLSAAMIVGTHEVTEPARAMGDVIRENDDIAQRAVDGSIKYGMTLAFALIFLFLVFVFWRLGWMPWHRRRGVDRAKPAGGSEAV
jgi:hypothetical protein